MIRVSDPRRVFLQAEWRDLAMLNYEVPLELVRPYLPAGVELDTFEGRCFVSIVGFRFLRTRLLGLPIPFHRNFDEINLRLYVRRRVGSETQRGVVFVKEIVPRRAIAMIANVFYGENYAAHPMSHEMDRETRRVTYGWRNRGRSNAFTLQLLGSPAVPEPDSEPEFITEHYWGYTKRSPSRTSEYQVEHPQWRVCTARIEAFDVDIAATYGAEWEAHLHGQPASAFVAEGSPVRVRYPQDLSE